MEEPLDELFRLLILHMLDFLDPMELGELGGLCYTAKTTTFKHNFSAVLIYEISSTVPFNADNENPFSFEVEMLKILHTCQQMCPFTSSQNKNFVTPFFSNPYK